MEGLIKSKSTPLFVNVDDMAPSDTDDEDLAAVAANDAEKVVSAVVVPPVNEEPTKDTDEEKGKGFKMPDRSDPFFEKDTYIDPELINRLAQKRGFQKSYKEILEEKRTNEKLKELRRRIESSSKRVAMLESLVEEVKTDVDGLRNRLKAEDEVQPTYFDELAPKIIGAKLASAPSPNPSEPVTSAAETTSVQ